jgi:hypothetical protein
MDSAIGRAWGFVWRAVFLGAIAWGVGKALDAAVPGFFTLLGSVTPAFFTSSPAPLWFAVVGVFAGLFWAAWPSIKPRSLIERHSPPVRVPDASPLPQSLPSNEAREYVSVTPQDLRRLFEGRTTAQGTALANQYVGKWMIVSGRLGDIWPLRPGMHRFQVTLAIGPLAIMSYYQVFLWFNEEWKERVEARQRGEQITVHGKVAEVQAIDVNLHDCEIT